MSRFSRVIRNPLAYLSIGRKAILQPLSRFVENSSFFLQGQMDIHNKSRWYNPKFVTKTGGFFPANDEAERMICKLEPWDNVRRDMLILLLRTIEENHVPGEIAEIGVYRGRTAKLFHYYAPQRQIHLFDTFEGFTDRSVSAEKENTGSTVTSSHFADTSEEHVLAYIAPLNNNISIHKGYFPSTIPTDFEDKAFAFVHLDADLYEPIFAGLNYFYDKLSPGGMIIVHDYNAWAGARSAVDEFFSQRPDFPLPLPDKSGSALIIKPQLAPNSEKQ